MGTVKFQGQGTPSSASANFDNPQQGFSLTGVPALQRQRDEARRRAEYNDGDWDKTLDFALDPLNLFGDGGLFGRGGPLTADTSFIQPIQGDPALRDAAASIGASRVPTRQLDRGMIDPSLQLQLDPNGSRAQQQSAINMAARAAAGAAPSAAEIQSRRAVEQATADQFALANSARGGVGAQVAAQRGAGRNAQQLANQGIADTAALRAQEQAAARGLFGNLTAQQRAGDQGIAGLEAGLAGQNLGAAVQADQLDLQRQGLALEGFGDAERIRTDQFFTPQQIRAQIEAAQVAGNQALRNGLIGGAFSGLGSIFSA